MKSAYEVYSEWCRDHGHKPPSKTWWDRACAQPAHNEGRDADQREIDRERKEGWAYGSL